MKWIENRSPLTRWILVPIVFIASWFLVHAFIVVASWGLSLFWGRDAETNLWFYKEIIASGLSAYCAAMFSGWTAPKFKFATTCVFSAIYLLTSAVFIYVLIAMPGVLESDAIWRTLSLSFGAMTAIWHAKKKFLE